MTEEKLQEEINYWDSECSENCCDSQENLSYLHLAEALADAKRVSLQWFSLSRKDPIKDKISLEVNELLDICKAKRQELNEIYGDKEEKLQTPDMQIEDPGESL